MSTDNSQPSTPSPQHQQAKQTSNAPLYVLIVVAIAIATALFWPLERGDGGTPAARPIVLVDTEALIESHTAGMQKRNVSPDKIAQEAETFAKQLRDAISTYGKTSIVANKYYAMAWPEGSDITHEVANALGIDLSLKMEARRNVIPEDL